MCKHWIEYTLDQNCREQTPYGFEIELAEALFDPCHYPIVISFLNTVWTTKECSRVAHILARVNPESYRRIDIKFIDPAALSQIVTYIRAMRGVRNLAEGLYDRA